MILTGAARLAGVAGWPVSHSRSPAIHDYWLRVYGIDGAYVPLAIRPENAAEAFRTLPKLGFCGWNVTLPHKEAAFRAVDERSVAAERIGAVNTVTVREDGSLHGDNTDAYGFVAHLDQRVPEWPKNRPVSVLGAGGAARAVCFALAEAGVLSIRLANRNAARANALAAEWLQHIETVEWEHRAEALAGVGLLVNTTSLGMHGQEPLAMSLDALPADATVYDIVYVPTETPLLADAATRGNQTIGGLGMLLHQATQGFARWFGRQPAVTGELFQSIAKDIPQ